MTRFTTRAIIVVPLANRVAMRTAAKLVDPNGDGAFNSELSASGNVPATHFWANWQMEPRERTRMQTDLDNLVTLGAKVFWLDHYDPAQAKPTSNEVLTQLGLKRIKRL